MKKRRTADEVARSPRDADRDPAQGRTVADLCRTIAVAATTDDRWRPRHDPARVDAGRRCRALAAEGERLERRGAESRSDKPMLQGIAPRKW